MVPALRIRIWPTTPWRIGSDSGDRDQAGLVYHSDSLFSAVCQSFARLDLLDTWLAATVVAPDPAVRFTSCFPFLEDSLFVPPPQTLWPPAASPKVRWKAVRFVPVDLVRALQTGQAVADDRWIVDPASGCLLALDRRGEAVGPFRPTTRLMAAVDRVTGGAVAPHRVLGVEYAPGAGLWCAALFRDSEALTEWRPRLEAAFRWLCDSGFGGRRSLGFGRAAAPDFAESSWPALVRGEFAEPARNGGWWMLSLFSPSADDALDWSSGCYRLLARSGRIESRSGWGTQKLSLRMLEEGSVVAAAQVPLGAAFDVAPPGFPHPVWRAAFAAAVPLQAPEAA